MPRFPAARLAGFRGSSIWQGFGLRGWEFGIIRTLVRLFFEPNRKVPERQCCQGFQRARVCVFECVCVCACVCVCVCVCVRVRVTMMYRRSSDAEVSGSEGDPERERARQLVHPPRTEIFFY